MRNFMLLVKPAGPDCNLDCSYCFYSGKTSYLGTGTHRMSEAVLEKMIADYMSNKLPAYTFAWQGGEPTLMGLDFYKKVVALQKQYAGENAVVQNAFQTNGLLLGRAWCEFLRENKFLVGISLDGPREYHDAYRLDHGGRGSFDKVMAAIELCRENQVEFNILVLLNDKNIECPDELFDFFTTNEIQYLQFITCVEKDPDTNEIFPFSVTPEAYSRFLCRLFDRWLDFGPEKLSIRMFDSILAHLVHGKHSICTFNRKCDDYIVIEHNGDAFCCDFFVEPEHRLGNLLETPLIELLQSPVKQDFARAKSRIHNQCFLCRYQPLCRGGCLKDRIIQNNDFAHPSYFCPSYKTFFEYALPRFQLLASEITRNR